MFTTGKVGFSTYRIFPGETVWPDWEAISERIKEKPYEPLKEDKTQSISFVDPSCEIEEDYLKKTYKNPGTRSKVLIDVLHQNRVPDAALVKRRIKERMDKEAKRMQRTEKNWKPDKEWKEDIRIAVREEETLKAPPKLKRTQFCLDYDNRLVYISGASKASQNVVEDSLAFLFPGTAVMLRNAMFDEAESSGITALEPFALLPIHSNPPEDVEHYAREWLTWMFISSDIDHKMGTFAEMAYYAGDRVKGSLKTNNVSSPVAEFGYAEMYDGGLVNQFTLEVDANVFDPKDKSSKTHVKVDRRGYISEIDPKMSAKDRYDGTPIVLDGVASAYNIIKQDESKYFKLRTGDECEYVKYMRSLLEFICARVPFPEDIENDMESFEDDDD